jgi:photosystem I reaction center subunit XII
LRLERNKWTNPCNSFIKNDWRGNEEMIIEVQFFIAFVLAFATINLAIKLGKAFYD